MSAAPKRSRFSDKPLNEPSMAPPAVPMGGSDHPVTADLNSGASLAKVAKTETTTSTGGGSAPAWKLPESALVPLGINNLHIFDTLYYSYYENFAIFSK